MGQYCCCLKTNTKDNKEKNSKAKIRARESKIQVVKKKKEFNFHPEELDLESPYNRLMLSPISPQKSKSRGKTMRSISTQTEEELILSYIEDKKAHYIRLKKLFEEPNFENNLPRIEEFERTKESILIKTKQKLPDINNNNNKYLPKKSKISTNQNRVEKKTTARKNDTLVKDKKNSLNLESFESDKSVIQSEERDEIVSIEKLNFQGNLPAIKEKNEKGKRKQKREAQLNQSLILSNGRELKKKFISGARHSIFGNLPIIELQRRPLNPKGNISNSKASKSMKNKKRKQRNNKKEKKETEEEPSIRRRVKSLGKNVRDAQTENQSSQYQKPHRSLDKNVRETKSILKNKNFQLNVKKTANIDPDLTKKLNQLQLLKRHSVFDEKMMKKFNQLSQGQKNQFMMSKRNLDEGVEKIKKEGESSSYSSSNSSWVLKDLIKEREEKELDHYRSFHRARTIGVHFKAEEG